MTDETVLVTGASSGIGRAVAERFLDDDWTVYASARDPDDVAGLSGRGAETPALDVTDPSACTDVVEEIVAGEGRLDCLVNNAGYAQYGPVEDVPTGRLHRQLAVNCYGPHRLTRLALPHMREAGGGTVVNVSSAAALVSAPGYGAYSASKAALESLSDALRAEVHGDGVEVVLVEPGPVETAFQDRGVAELRALERTPGYEAIYAFLEDRAATRSIGAVEPDAVAAAVHEAATCADPPARIPVGPVATVAAYARHLPDGVRDLGFRIARRLLS